MIYGLILSESGRILSVGIFYRGIPKNVTAVTVLPIGAASDYRYVNGMYIYDPLPAGTSEE